MILIKPGVYNILNQYHDYLVKESLTSKRRAREKKNLIIQALHERLGGIVRYRFSAYQSFGAPEGYRLYVYKDPKSKTQWGFIHQEFYEDGYLNVIVYDMKNMLLVN